MAASCYGDSLRREPVEAAKEFGEDGCFLRDTSFKDTAGAMLERFYIVWCFRGIEWNSKPVIKLKLCGNTSNAVNSHFQWLAYISQSLNGRDKQKKEWQKSKIVGFPLKY